MSSDYGVEYTPAISTPTHLSNVSFTSLRSTVQYIRLTWVDFINNTRHRVIPYAYFAKLLSAQRPGIHLPKIALGIVGITAAEGFKASGEYLYVPDMSTLRMCPYERGTASVMGWFEEKEPTPGKALFVPLCPRSTLRRVVEEARLKANINFLVGFETEFILLSSTNPIVPVNQHGWSNSTALPSGSVEAKVMRDIADALKEGGVELQMYHAEAAPGQYEVVTAPLPPVEAADALVFTREVIVNVAAIHGLRATLAPRLFPDNCGSSSHTHISVHPTTGPADTTHLAPHETSFLSGLLEHLPAIQALTTPLSASYARMHDGIWSGGTYVCWGTYNKETPVRVCNAGSPIARNFEVKCVDGLANPHLALAAILAAGANGVEQSSPLTIKDLNDVSAAELSPEARVAHGITTRMSLSWQEARQRLVEDRVLCSALDPKLVEAYLSTNLTLEKWVESDKETALRKLVEHY